MKTKIISVIGDHATVTKEGVLIPTEKLNALAQALADINNPVILNELKNNVSILTTIVKSHDVQQFAEENLIKLLLLRIKFNQNLIDKLEGSAA